MTRRMLAGLLMAGLLVGSSPAGRAARFDLDLSRFGEFRPGGGGIARDAAGFESMATDLGLTLLPRLWGSGNTLGSRGFDVGYNFVLTDISQNASHWQKPAENPARVLHASQLAVRKGLPYSFQLGGVVTRLHESDLWGVALELGWSFVESMERVPDIGMHLHVGSALGSEQLAMLMTGADLRIGKTFPLGGVVRLTPFASYAVTYMRAQSHALAAFPRGGLEPETFLLPNQSGASNIVSHRGVVGIRMVATLVEFGFEAALGRTQTYAFRIGLNF